MPLLFLLLTAAMSLSVNAEAISDEKLKLMIAAGEIPPVQTVTEENVKVKKDAAVEIAKTMLENAASYEMTNSYLNEKWGPSGNPAWSIDFASKQAPGGNANVTVDAVTGGILAFSSWLYQNGQQNYVVKMTRAEAVAVAEEFVKNRLKLDPAGYELQKEDPYANNYKMGGVKETVTYNYSFIRKVNGILLSSDSIYVGVDGTSGRVSSFSRNFAPVDMTKLPSQEGILSADQALEKYRGSVGFALQYITTYQNNPYASSRPRVMLAYVPTIYSDMIDAVTGKPIGYDGTEISPATEAQQQFAIAEPKPLAPGATLTEKAVTESEAKALAEASKKIVEDTLGVKFDISSGTVQEVYSKAQADTWNYSWYKKLWQYQLQFLYNYK